MKRIIAIIICFGITLGAFSQQKTAEQRREDKRNAKREKMNTLMRMEEEGVPSFHKQNAFGIKVNTDGWGISYELERANSITRATIFQIEFNEKKHRKEQKDNFQSSAGGFVFFGNPFVYGKKNIFYQLKLAAGQQILIGGKNNKNGVSVYGIGAGGLSLGFLRPYYIEVQDQLNENRYVKYDSPDSLLFLNSGAIIGGAGIAKGWNEMKLAPGLHAKTALRFDYNRFNTIVSAIEGGINVEYYFKGIEQMAYNPSRKLFVNAYVSFLFGKRQ